MPLIRVFVAVLLAVLLGCSWPGRLQDQFTTAELRMPLEERLRKAFAAPLIVVGKVISVKEQGSPRNSPGDPRIKTQLTQITVSVEAVIKGKIPSNQLSFFIFLYSYQNDRDLGVPTDIPQPGMRRILFLKHEGQKYRSIGDVTRYYLPVHGGSPPTGICAGKHPGQCIAEILLKPQPDADVAWFAHDLGASSAYAAAILSSPRQSWSLVNELTRHPDERIAQSARGQLQLLEQMWPELKEQEAGRRPE